MRHGCCAKNEGLNRGAWTSQEDKLLSDYIMAHGLGKWRSLPANAGLNRCGKSCRLRWLNYLRPDIKRGNITKEEEELIIRLHKLLGNRWSLIAGRLPGRTDNEIKNYWNTCLNKRISASGPSSQQNRQAGMRNPNKQKAATGSEINIIRTKAVRCTKGLFIDQAPNCVMKSIINTSQDNQFISSELMQHNQSSLLTENSSYATSDNWQSNYDFIDTACEENFGRICISSIEDADGLYHFINSEEWDKLFLHPKH